MIVVVFVVVVVVVVAYADATARELLLSFVVVVRRRCCEIPAQISNGNDRCLRPLSRTNTILRNRVSMSSGFAWCPALHLHCVVEYYALLVVVCTDETKSFMYCKYIQQRYLVFVCRMTFVGVSRTWHINFPAKNLYLSSRHIFLR